MSGARRWIAPVALALAAIIPYLGALDNGFVFDDKGLIVENESVTDFRLGRIWSSPYWPNNPDAGLYRPVTITSFALDWAWTGGSPAGFIAANVLLHAVTTLLAWRILLRLFPRRPREILFACLLFAVHPIHVEAVAGIVGRAEILAAFFALAAYLLWLDAGEREGAERFACEAAAPLLWLLALLSKESSLGLPVLLLLHRLGVLGDAPRGKPPFRRADLGWPVAFVLLMAVRMRVLHGWIAPKIPFVDNPLAGLDPLRRVLGACGVLARQLAQVVHGRGLSSDYSYAAVEPGPGLYALGAVGLLLLAAGILAAVRSGRGGLLRWGIACFLSFWILTSNVILAVGTVQADRLLYLPLLGIGAVLAALLARGAALARDRGLLALERRAIPWTAAAWVVVMAAGAWIRAGDWHDNLRLFGSAVETTPRNLKARSNLAAVLLETKGSGAAREVLDLIAPVEEIKSRCGPLLIREGKARIHLGDLDGARASLRAALAAQADSSEAWIEIGNIALMQDSGAEALEAFDAAARTKRRARHAAIGRASALSILRRYEESAEAWLPIVATLPDSVPVRIACAWNLNEAGRGAEAVRLLEEGLRRSRDHRILDQIASILSGEDAQE